MENIPSSTQTHSSPHISVHTETETTTDDEKSAHEHEIEESVEKEEKVEMVHAQQRENDEEKIAMKNTNMHADEHQHTPLISSSNKQEDLSSSSSSSPPPPLPSLPFHTSTTDSTLEKHVEEVEEVILVSENHVQNSEKQEEHTKYGEFDEFDIEDETEPPAHALEIPSSSSSSSSLSHLSPSQLISTDHALDILTQHTPSTSLISDNSAAELLKAVELLRTQLLNNTKPNSEVNNNNELQKAQEGHEEAEPKKKHVEIEEKQPETPKHLSKNTRKPLLSQKQSITPLSSSSSKFTPHLRLPHLSPPPPISRSPRKKPHKTPLVNTDRQAQEILSLHTTLTQLHTKMKQKEEVLVHTKYLLSQANVKIKALAGSEKANVKRVKRERGGNEEGISASSSSSSSSSSYHIKKIAALNLKLSSLTRLNDELRAKNRNLISDLNIAQRRTNLKKSARDEKMQIRNGKNNTIASSKRNNNINNNNNTINTNNSNNTNHSDNNLGRGVGLHAVNSKDLEKYIVLSEELEQENAQLHTHIQTLQAQLNLYKHEKSLHDTNTTNNTNETNNNNETNYSSLLSQYEARGELLSQVTTQLREMMLKYDENHEKLMYFENELKIRDKKDEENMMREMMREREKKEREGERDREEKGEKSLYDYLDDDEEEDDEEEIHAMLTEVVEAKEEEGEDTKIEKNSEHALSHIEHVHALTPLHTTSLKQHAHVTSSLLSHLSHAFSTQFLSVRERRFFISPMRDSSLSPEKMCVRSSLWKLYIEEHTPQEYHEKCVKMREKEDREIEREEKEEREKEKWKEYFSESNRNSLIAHPVRSSLSALLYAEEKREDVPQFLHEPKRKESGKVTPRPPAYMKRDD